MTKVLWCSNEVDVYYSMLPDPPDYGEIDLQLDGVARWYLERREALRKQAPQPPRRGRRAAVTIAPRLALDAGDRVPCGRGLVARLGDRGCWRSATTAAAAGMLHG